MTHVVLLAAIPIALAIVAAARAARALTVSGALAAFFVGVACLGAGGIPVGAALLAFFVTGSVLSSIRGPHAADAAAAKTGPRDAAQVLANGGPAAICALMAGHVAIGDPTLAMRWIAAAIASLAVAAADTWATEIGALSLAPPRSILTARVVRAGTSGGVTPLGFLASIAGGAAIGLCAGAFAAPHHILTWIAGGALVGFAGSAFDSLLGASVQGVWRCDACETECERAVHRCGAPARPVHGWAWLDNDGVNAASTIAGAAAGFLIGLPMR